MIGELLSVGIEANQSRLLSDVRSGSKAPFLASAVHFRSTPNNGHRETGPTGPVRAAMKRHARRFAPKFCTGAQKGGFHVAILSESRRGHHAPNVHSTALGGK
jgi:hypothetical protein